MPKDATTAGNPRSEGVPFGLPFPITVPPPSPAVAKSPDDQIADLRKSIAEKDHAMAQASIKTAEIQEELEIAKAEVAALRSQPDMVGRDPVQAANTAVEAELARITAQHRLAQKTVERSQTQLRTELVSLKARCQHAERQLESERKARQAESAGSSQIIATLEQELVDARTKPAAEKPGGKHLRYVLSAAAVSGALVVAAVWGWPRMMHESSSSVSVNQVTAQTPEPTNVSRKVRVQIPYSTRTPTEFQGALGRLNDDLANFPGRDPEDVLTEVRHAVSDPGVCAFRWNGGQPALVFGGSAGGGSMASSLNRCAAAVETLLTR